MPTKNETTEKDIAAPEKTVKALTASAPLVVLANNHQRRKEMNGTTPTHKYATFAWAITVEVPMDFDPDNDSQWEAALRNAYANVQASDGELTDTYEDTI
jgi:hypothetical protein